MFTGTARSAGATTTMAMVSATKPTPTSSIPSFWLPPLPAPLPTAPSRRNAPTRKPMPMGTARCRSFSARAGGLPAPPRSGSWRSPSRPRGGEVGRDDREDHGDDDDPSRHLERAHHVVRALLCLRAVGEPGENAGGESERTHLSH